MSLIKSLVKKAGIPTSIEEAKATGSRLVDGASDLGNRVVAKAKNLELNDVAAALKLAKHKVDPQGVHIIYGSVNIPSIDAQEDYVRSMSQPIIVLDEGEDVSAAYWALVGAHFGTSLVIMVERDVDLSSLELADGVVVRATAKSLIHTDLNEFHMVSLAALKDQEGWD